MTVTRLEWDIRFNETVLPVVGGTLTVDDQNIPAIVGQVVVPHDDGLFDAIDPRQTPVPRIVLRGEQRHWASQPLSAVSAFAAAEGGTLGDLSAAWDGLIIDDLTAQFGKPLHGVATTDPNGRLRMSLHVREISTDGFTMTVDLASDEALLTDWAFTHASQALGEFSELQAGYNTQQVQAWVRPTLQMVLGRDIKPGPYDTTTLSEDDSEIFSNIYAGNVWETIIRPAIDDTGLRLRVHPDGQTFTLEHPQNTINEPSVHAWLFQGHNTISARRIRSRLGDWYDSAQLSADLPTGFGFIGYPAGAHSRTYREHFTAEQPNPTAAMAQNLVDRASNRGELIEIEAPIRLLPTGGVFMRDEFSYVPEGVTPGPDTRWITKSVHYDFLSGTMRLRGERRY